MPLEIEVDCFAGGGGASLGISQATGRSVAIAINHDPKAIEMHARNHPETLHFTEDVFAVNPAKATGGRPVGLLWLSPDCRHFSKAKGTAPVSKSVRSLAWVAVKWAKTQRPRVIVLENVREFEDWGPVVPQLLCRDCGWKGASGKVRIARRWWQPSRCPSCDSSKLRQTDQFIPNPDRVGWTFKRFVGRLQALGYRVEWRTLNAANYGAPTNRKRLFLIARCDGKPIVWPAPTHGKTNPSAEPLFAGIQGGLKPVRTAAEIIDWSLPIKSIFDRDPPLVEKTLRRLAFGIKRYVLDSPKPFLVTVNHGGDWFRGRGVDQPMPAATGINGVAVAVPFISKYHGQTSPADHHCTSADEPLRTVDTENRHSVVVPIMVGTGGSEYSAKPVPVDQPFGVVKTEDRRALVASCMVQVGYGERVGQDPRTMDVEAPLGTVVGAGKHGVAAVSLVDLQRDNPPRSVEEPLGTVTSQVNRFNLVTAFLAKHFGGVVGVPVETPLPTITSVPTQTQVVAANLVHLNHGDKQWSSLTDPLRTVTAGGNKAFLVYSFLSAYFGNSIGCSIDDPVPSATSQPKYGVVTVTIDGCVYAIVDIGMRMLTPSELKLAQGFPSSYILTGSKANQTHKVGNSVSPPVARAIVEANYKPKRVRLSAAV